MGWWDPGDGHYVSSFATWPAKIKLGYDSALLAFSSLGNEEKAYADENIDFINFTLGVFSKNASNVVALVGDYCSVNKLIAKKLDVGFVRCSSHRFNQAVCDVLKKHDHIIILVRNVMELVKTGINRTKLRRLTHLYPVIDQETRWSSTYQMLIRFQRPKDHIKALQIYSVTSIMPKKNDSQQIEEVTKRLAHHYSITQKLQKEETKFIFGKMLVWRGYRILFRYVLKTIIKCTSCFTARIWSSPHQDHR